MIIRLNTKCGCTKLVYDVDPRRMPPKYIVAFQDSRGVIMRSFSQIEPTVKPGGIVEYAEISDEPVNPDEGSNNVK